MATSKDDDDFVTVLECVKINDKESAFFFKRVFLFRNNTEVLFC